MIADVAPPLICQYTLSELAPARHLPGGCWGFTGPIPLPLWINVARYSFLSLIMGRGGRDCQTVGGWEGERARKCRGRPMPALAATLSHPPTLSQPFSH